MVESNRGQIDTSVVVGVIVVVAVLGAAVFGVYYLGFVRPKRLQLEELKDDSLQELDSTLATVDTSQADMATTQFRTKIRTAESTKEVEAVMEEVSHTYQVEKKREELMMLAKNTTHGSFDSLDSLYDNFKSEIQSLETLSELNDFESTMKSQATQEWRQTHISDIESATTEELVMQGNSSPQWFRVGISENEALALVDDMTLKELSSRAFKETGSYEIPITYDLGEAPTLMEDSTVDVRIYDLSDSGEVENEWVLGEGLAVEHVLYNEEDLGTIEWQKQKDLSGNEDTIQNGLTTDIEEEIKAQVMGHNNAEVPEDWGKDVVSHAMESNIELSEIEVTCLVNVPIQGDATRLLDYVRSEQYEVVPIPHVD